MRCCQLVLSILVVLLVHSSVVQAAPMVFFGKFDAPDFNQLNTAYPNGGENYCVPTSCADGIVWLHDHGFGALPDASQEEDIINELANLMGTNPDAGTGSTGAINGMESYLRRYYEDIFSDSFGVSSSTSESLEEQWEKVENYVSQPDTVVILRCHGYSNGYIIASHAVFLAGYDMTNYASSENFEVSVHDPYTGPTELTDTYTVEAENISGNYYYATTEYVGTDDFPVDKVSVYGAYAFQIVPEPGLLALLITSMLAMLNMPWFGRQSNR
ncbi:MAG: hypothetical protein JXM70_19700 [Pirellulales bacterium]|nr:hypothetical protein [Pirellulales bacterium]